MTTAGVVKQRSPNFPGHDLSQAVEDVKKLYAREQRAPFTYEVGAKALGFGSLNGTARVRLATLRQYGLLDLKRGSEEAKLSERAVTIALRNPSSREYAQAMRDAALEPPLFRQFHETRPGASDDSLRHYLVVNAKFTNEGAARFIQAFRGTLSVAGLGVREITSRQEDDFSADDGDMMSDVLVDAPKFSERDRAAGAASAHVNSDNDRIPLRLVGGALVIVELPREMSKKAWEQMITMLEAHRPGYVLEDEPIGQVEATSV